MAKKKPGRQGKGRAGGRVVERPPWEAAWKRASKASSRLWWTNDSADDPLPSHEEVFEVLDSLASADDGLGSLAALAAVLDVTEEHCDVTSELRAVAERTVDQSEAALFAGYADPGSASPADASAMAGRMLRAHRDRDLDAMVETANLNPRLFVERPYVGVLTIAPVLSHEITRDLDQQEVAEQVSAFFDDCPVPVAGAEYLANLILGGIMGQWIERFGDEAIREVDGVDDLCGIGGQVMDNRPLVDRFLEWGLGVASQMQEKKASRSIDQCGVALTDDFAAMVCTLAALVSEEPATRRFRNVVAPAGSSYGNWQRWQELVSPKGFTHRTIGSFTPEDLLDAYEAVPFRGEVARLVNSIGTKGTSPGFHEDLRAWSISRRQEWLVWLSRLLAGESNALDVLTEFEEDPPSMVPFGPVGPTVAAQELVLWLCSDAELTELEREGSVVEDEDRALGLEVRQGVAQRLADRLRSALDVGDLAADELRGLEGWVGLASEMAASGVRQPTSDFDPFTVGEDLGRWLAQLGGWLKARAWKPPKERPEVEEIPEVEPAIRSGPEVADDGPVLDHEETLEPADPVQIVYVGGNEIQARIQQQVEDHVHARYGGLVTVEWIHIDWGARWAKDADRVDGLMAAGADAVVLLPLVRTGMGERVRRSTGEHGVPWIPCTGRGQTSAKRAIDEAVQVVCRRRLDD